MANPVKNDIVRRSKRKPDDDLFGDAKPPAKISRRSSPPKKAASKQEEQEDEHGCGKQPTETSKAPSPSDLNHGSHDRRPDSLTADWSSLPNDLLISITTRLRFLDYVRFTAACNPWRSILSERQITPHPRRPWFMLDFKCFSKTFWFVTLHGDFHSLRLPEPSLICCSSRGWLMVSTRWSRKFFRYYLLNPFSMAKVGLPSMPPFPITGMVLSSSPTSEGCILMAVGDRRQVGFLSMDCPTWRRVPLQQSMGIEDAVFFEGRFYFITGKGKLGFFQKGDRGAGSTGWVRSWVGLRSVRKPPGRRVKRYLTVGPDGKTLLLVRRLFRRRSDDRVTFGGDVFEMRTDIMQWKATTFPPEEALFLSDFSSIAFAAHEHRRLHPCSFFGNGGEDWWGYEQNPNMAQLFSKVGNLQLVAPYL